ncbi:hypothetical protein QAD02_006990 [Eretmocerus hayati]|uniref:Uncharacterized protein n=1 Tax=Eretmocerus hayati TaxID=131215 RepID=A0ACC2N3Q1_9HYME|nr:hypothetical protein QAD02_006990 [Eretmocerus hayati]
MILTCVLLLKLIKPAQSALNGVIWDEVSHTFTPLSGLSELVAVENEYTQQRQNLEHHNFQREILKVAYYEEPNLVSFVDNDTRITGVCGELWMTLADYLNFTLIPVKLETKNFGHKLENGSYDGVLGLIQQNLSQIIPRCGIFKKSLALLDYTIPFWRIRYHLYIKPEWKHDEIWMFRLFTVGVWYSFFSSLVVLGVVGYICEKHSIKTHNEKVRFNLQDHMFYTVAIASSQGSVPEQLHHRSRVIYLCTSIFSWVIFIAYNSNAIFLMSNKNFILPFTDLRSLFRGNDYSVVAFSGSMVHDEFEATIMSFHRPVHDFGRVSYEPSAAQLFEKVCFTERKKLAAFEAADRHKAIGRYICQLIPTEASYFKTWIASAIKRGFPYKRSFDTGILKMSESGLIDALKKRWLDRKSEVEQENFLPIDMSQVYLIFCVLISGISTSIIVFLVENLTFYRTAMYRTKNQKPLLLLT